MTAPEIKGATTSTTGFVGPAPQGPLGTPVTLASVADFESNFGDRTMAGADGSLLRRGRRVTAPVVAGRVDHRGCAAGAVEKVLGHRLPVQSGDIALSEPMQCSSRGYSFTIADARERQK